MAVYLSGDHQDERRVLQVELHLRRGGLVSHLQVIPTNKGIPFSIAGASFRSPRPPSSSRFRSDEFLHIASMRPQLSTASHFPFHTFLGPPNAPAFSKSHDSHVSSRSLSAAPIRSFTHHHHSHSFAHSSLASSSSLPFVHFSSYRSIDYGIIRLENRHRFSF